VFLAQPFNAVEVNARVIGNAVIIFDIFALLISEKQIDMPPSDQIHCIAESLGVDNFQNL